MVTVTAPSSAAAAADHKKLSKKALRSRGLSSKSSGSQFRLYWLKRHLDPPGNRGGCGVMFRHNNCCSFS
jgi:hypothetical protein